MPNDEVEQPKAPTKPIEDDPILKDSVDKDSSFSRDLD